jgi:hypothetical protein
LFADDEMKQMVSLVEDLLPLHTLGYTGVRVVRNLLEVDNFSQDTCGVVGGLQQPWYKHRLE